MKEFIALTDILDKVTASDSECDLHSSGDELNDEKEVLSWTMMKFFDMMVMKMMAVMMIMVVMAVMTKVMMVMMMNLLPIERQNFVLPQLPLFISEPETPTLNDKIPVEYVNMFLTNYMIGNLVLESNKCCMAPKRLGHVQTLSKQRLQTYIGIYNLMGNVRLPRIDDY